MRALPLVVTVLASMMCSCGPTRPPTPEEQDTYDKQFARSAIAFNRQQFSALHSERLARAIAGAVPVGRPAALTFAASCLIQDESLSQEYPFRLDPKTVSEKPFTPQVVHETMRDGLKLVPLFSTDTAKK